MFGSIRSRPNCVREEGKKPVKRSFLKCIKSIKTVNNKILHKINQQISYFGNGGEIFETSETVFASPSVVGFELIDVVGRENTAVYNKRNHPSQAGPYFMPETTNKNFPTYI